MKLPAAATEFSLGITSLSRRDVRAALGAFERAEALGHSAVECAAQRWTCWMLLGEFERAWVESDFIASSGLPDPHALWDGTPFEGKRIVIRCLHGYGDAIQFLRYAEAVRRTAPRVIVETHPELVSLVRLIRGVDEAVTWETGGIPRTAWDAQIEVTELPRAFRATVTTIPVTVPYIEIAESAIQQSRRNLGPAAGKRIGLVWASSAWNPARCIPLQHLRPILDIPNCSFYSFQRGPQAEELTALRESFEIHDTSLHSPDISHTAADLMNMDLLISVDTMAAHLAGALGRRVWTLLPSEADWRWMATGDRTAWYPTMRLFRQTSPGEWDSVVTQLKHSLAKLANELVS